MSLEDCEKFYLEEFRKLLLEKNFEYGHKLKYCDDVENLQIDKYNIINYTSVSEFKLKVKKKEKIDYYFIIFDKIPFINVTYPILSKINDNMNLYRFYKIIDVNDTILIWGLLNKYGIYHISCQIITHNGFSFSFGILEGDEILEKKIINNFTTYNSILSTPDILFENKIKKQMEKPNQKHLKLIAISKLNRKHIELLKNSFDQLALENLKEYNLYLDFVSNNNTMYNQQINKNNYDILESLFNHENFDINTDYINYKEQKNASLKLFKNNSNRIFLRPFYYFTLPSMNYCKISRYHNKTINCTSFLQNMYDDIINCTGSSIVSIPRFCYQKKTAKRVTCPNLINNATKKYTKTYLNI